MTDKTPGIEKARSLLEQYPDMRDELAALAKTVETPAELKVEKIQAVLETTEVADAEVIDQLRKLGMDPAIFEKLPPAA